MQADSWRDVFISSAQLQQFVLMLGAACKILAIGHELFNRPIGLSSLALYLYVFSPRLPVIFTTCALEILRLGDNAFTPPAHAS